MGRVQCTGHPAAEVEKPQDGLRDQSGFHEREQLFKDQGRSARSFISRRRPKVAPAGRPRPSSVEACEEAPHSSSKTCSRRWALKTCKNSWSSSCAGPLAISTSIALYV